MLAASKPPLNQPMNWVRFSGIAVQIALICAIIYLYGIEQGRGMYMILPLLFGGFIVNAVIPQRHRMSFFLAVSVASFFLILGLKFALILVAISLLLVAVCHLPLPFWIRVAGLLVISVGLGLVQSGRVLTGWGAIVIPILGSMFMFRLVIYLYDLRNEKEAVSWSARLAYFFMLPNVCFPLFPVVDYRAFLRSHYAADALTTYQTGAKWMLRGVIHLLMYRFIYQTFTDGPGDLAGLNDVLVYMLSTYLLYLRVSGLFHLVVGVMCIFGFNLPETHHLYYLASSFSDYWRRINIYWKDFMMKLFYYPVYMRFKKQGPTTAMVIATIVVFFGTWILHAYQWFWLQGAFPITTVDSAFWAILGVLVIVNSVYQARHPKKASLRKPAWSWKVAIIHSAKVAAMFCCITTLWTLWSGSSIREFVSVLQVAASGSAGEFALLAGILVGAMALGVAVQYANHHQWFATLEKSPPWFLRIEATSIATALVIAVFGIPGVEKSLGERLTQLSVTLKSDGLNKRDVHAMERGYYEGLLGGATFGAKMREAKYQPPPEDWILYVDSGADEAVDGVLGTVLKPSYDSVIGRAATHTNEWGMRDHPYTKAKPADTYRAALLGSSYEMGFALEADYIYENMAEKTVNEALAARAAGAIEILNFSVPGYCLLEYVELTRERVWEFSPDAVFVAARTNDDSRSMPTLMKAIQQGIALSPGLAEIIAEAQVDQSMTEQQIQQGLARLGLKGAPFEERLLRWSYGEIARNCAEHGAKPVLLCVARTVDNDDAQIRDIQLKIARELGFLILDLDNAFDGHELEEIQIGPWDQHPNELGAQKLSERMAEEILDHLEPLGINATSSSAGSPAN